MDVQSAPVFGFPPGVVVAYAWSPAPAGWLLCDGANVSRTTYAALFALIGTGYGAGDGSTTFTVPDLRGRVIAGVDAGAGRLTTALAASGGMSNVTLAGAGGEDKHTPLASELFTHTHNHTHTISSAWRNASVTTNTMGSGGGGATSQGITPQNDATPSDLSASGAHNNVQPTLILNYIISTGGP